MTDDLNDPRSRLFVALDVSGAEAERLVALLGERVTHYKIGYQLGFAGGLGLGERLVRAGKTVFFDFKLHDIDNTVRHGVAALAATGAHYATVHAYPQTMRAAVAGRAGSGLKILAVTVLTSWNDLDCAEAGYSGVTRDLVVMKARQAAALGVDGLVASAEEAGLLRETGLPPAVEIVTPGIRLPGDPAGDQKRVLTPQAAIAAGATRLVVGRPITAAPDPAAAAEAMTAAIAEALGAG